MQYKSNKFVNVYGKNGGFWSKKFSFLNEELASYYIFIKAWFNNVTESNSYSDLGGISSKASLAAE